MNWIEILFNILLISGGFMAINKRMGNWKWRLVCLLFYFSGDIVMTIFGILIGLWSIVIVQSFFQIIGIIGIIKCIKQRSEEK